MRLKLVLFCSVLLGPFGIASAGGKCDRILANDELSECLGSEFSKADGLLNKTYNDLRARLSPEGKELLKKGQLAWLTYRDKDCEFQASAASGGQAYQPVYISCQTEKTARRVKELKGSGW